MPRRCCVPGCKSNYDSTLKENNVQVVTTFSFPKDAELKKSWIRAIPRDNWTPSTSAVVCAKHFQDKDVVRFQPYRNPNGDMQQLPLRCPKLAEGAIPTIFKGLPKYLSKRMPPERKNPECRRTAAYERCAIKIENFLDADKIKSFGEFCERLQTCLNNNLEKWNVKVSEHGVCFYILNIDVNMQDDITTFQEEVSVICSISITKNLVVHVYLKGIEIPNHDLAWLLPPSLILSRWSQIQNLLIRYKNNVLQDAIVTETVDQHLLKSKYYVSKALNAAKNNDKYGFTTQLEFIVNQMSLLTSKKRNYDPVTMIFAFLVYCQSAATYNLIRSYLFLPHKRYLQHISSTLHISPEHQGSEGGNNTAHYLHHVSKHLSDRERIVALLIDEIYVNRSLTFKGNSITGSAENNKNELAKTVPTKFYDKLLIWSF